MPSNYPSGLDSFAERDETQYVMPDHINAIQEAIVAIESELGINPSGNESDVAARLQAIHMELMNARSDNAATPIEYASLKDHLDAIHALIAEKSTQVWALPETPSGTIDGVNAVFQLSATPVAGSEMIFHNGLLTTDYTINGAEITFNTPPADNDTLRAVYRTA